MVLNLKVYVSIYFFYKQSTQRNSDIWNFLVKNSIEDWSGIIIIYL